MSSAGDGEGGEGRGEFTSGRREGFKNDGAAVNGFKSMKIEEEGIDTATAIATSTASARRRRRTKDGFANRGRRNR